MKPFIAPGRRLRWTNGLWAVLLLSFLLAAVAHASPVASSQPAPNWTVLLPPIVAIGLALLLREVVGALILGILVGSILLTPAHPFDALLRLPIDFFPHALADSSHAAIVLFSLMLGGMVGVLAKSGGMAGIVRSLSSLANNRRGGQIMTWLMGLIIFFDDYANTLLIGNTVRPYTDKLRLSRAKLAYIVDSTAAPVTSIAIISTWVGFEVGLIRDAAKTLVNVDDAYVLFLKAIPYSAYSLFALVLVAAIAFWGRELGPMRKAEESAQAGRDFTVQDARLDAMTHVEPGRYALLLALIPIALVIIATFSGLYFSGVSATGAGAPLFEILGQADSAAVLLASSFLGLLTASLLAVTIGRKKVGDVSEAMIDGFRAMMPAMVILLLAWSLGDVCERLGTADYVIEAVSGSLHPSLIPAALFLVAAAVSFSTGTSWGTMAILVPIALPLAHDLPLAAHASPNVVFGVLLGSVGAVLSGATFGDHCSPISDTTILSSMASGCNHIEHVRTQIPYALIGAGFGLVFGYLPAGLGVPPWIGLILGGGLIFFLPRFFRRVNRSAEEATP